MPKTALEFAVDDLVSSIIAIRAEAHGLVSVAPTDRDVLEKIRSMIRSVPTSGTRVELALEIDRIFEKYDL